MLSLNLTCFNSTLVQLKASAEELRFIIVAMFQFYLSSIKSEDLKSNGVIDCGFQFYLSSIKSLSALTVRNDKSSVSILP